MVVCHSSWRCFFKKETTTEKVMENKITVKGEEITIQVQYGGGMRL